MKNFQDVVENVARRVLHVVLRIVPTTRSAVVFSVSSTEGNASEVLRWLERNFDGEIAWLLPPGFNSSAVSKLLNDAPAETRIRLLSKKSLRGFAVWTRAEIVLFTDPLYRGPKPPPNRTFVNLWHGDGPKPDLVASTANNPAQITVAGTKLWGQGKVKAFKSPSVGLRVVGNPRIDQYLRPASDSQLISLGLSPDRPFVLWAPTFRTVRHDALISSWSDSSDDDPFREVRKRQAEIAESLARSGIQVVVKRHPLDSEEYKFDGFVHLDDEKLLSVSAGLYQVLARSTALVTDYSSIWTDYLPLDRPIALFCPDLETYSQGRGFDVPEFAEFAPGPLLHDVDELIRFVSELVELGDRVGADLRSSITRRIGAVTETGATERLMRPLV